MVVETLTRKKKSLGPGADFDGSSPGVQFFVKLHRSHPCYYVIWYTSTSLLLFLYETLRTATRQSPAFHTRDARNLIICF